MGGWGRVGGGRARAPHPPLNPLLVVSGKVADDETKGSQNKATQCVCRALNLRQKLIVLSKSPAAETEYEQHLVQGCSLSGLRQDRQVKQ